MSNSNLDDLLAIRQLPVSYLWGSMWVHYDGHEKHVEASLTQDPPE